MVGLSGVFMAMTFAVFVVYGLFAASIRDRVITRPKAPRKNIASSPRAA